MKVLLCSIDLIRNVIMSDVVLMITSTIALIFPSVSSIFSFIGGIGCANMSFLIPGNGVNSDMLY